MLIQLRGELQQHVITQSKLNASITGDGVETSSTRAIKYCKGERVGAAVTCAGSCTLKAALGKCIHCAESFVLNWQINPSNDRWH